MDECTRIIVCDSIIIIILADMIWLYERIQCNAYLICNGNVHNLPQHITQSHTERQLIYFVFTHEKLRHIKLNTYNYNFTSINTGVWHSLPTRCKHTIDTWCPDNVETATLALQHAHVTVILLATFVNKGDYPLPANRKHLSFLSFFFFHRMRTEYDDGDLHA